MIIEAHFAERAGTSIGEHRVQTRFHPGVPVRRIMGMHARRDAQTGNGDACARTAVRAPFVGGHALVGKLQPAPFAFGGKRRARGLEHIGKHAQCLAAPCIHRFVRGAAVFIGVDDRADEIDAVHRATRERKHRVAQKAQMGMGVGDGGFERRIGGFRIAPSVFLLFAKQRVAKCQITRGAFGVDAAMRRGLFAGSGRIKRRRLFHHAPQLLFNRPIPPSRGRIAAIRSACEPHAASDAARASVSMAAPMPP